MTSIDLPPRRPDLLPSFIAEMDPDGRGKLCIFDADGTLWRDDVADDFCTWMIRERHVDTGNLWPRYLEIYRDDHAAGCRFMLKFYKGLTRSALAKRVNEFWLQEKRNWIFEATEAVYWLAEHGYTCWIVTGSPTDTMLPLVGALPFSRVLGMDFALDEAGVITGALGGISCADEGKVTAVKAAQDGHVVALGAGNGTLDAAMISLGEVRWSVYPNPTFEASSRARGWHVLPRPADFVEEDKLA